MNKVPIRSGTFYRSCSVSCKCVRRLRMLCSRRLYQINKCRPSQITCTVRTVYATCTQTALHVHKTSCTILIPLCEINLNLSMCYFFLPCACLAPLVHDDFMLATSLRCHCTKKWSFPFRISSVNVTKCAGNRIWSHLLKNSLMENLIFCAVCADFFVCLFLQKSIL